jgi:enterobacterial common antigen flippase
LSRSSGEGTAAAAATSPSPDPVPSSNSGVVEIILGLGGIQVAAMLFNLIRGKTMAVMLGPAGVGAGSLIDQVSVFIAQLAALSLPWAGVKFLSAADSEGREKFERLYRAFFGTLLLLSLAGAAVSVALLIWRPEVLGAELYRYRSAAILGLLSIPAINLTVLITNAMAASRLTIASGLYGLATAALLAVFCWVGISQAGLNGYYLGNLVAMVALVIGGLVFVSRRLGIRLLGSATNPFRELMRHPRILRFSGLMYIASFTSPLSDLLVRYAVLQTGGLSATGLFQSAAGLGLTMRAVLRPSFSLFLTPKLNHDGTPAEKMHQTTLFLRVLSVVIGLGALPVVLFPKFWLLLLYSAKFETAAPAIYPFVLGVGVQTIAGAYIALLLGLDDTPAFVWATVVSDIATAIFAWILAPRLGLAGVGAAFILDGATTLTLTVWWLHYRHRLAIHRDLCGAPAVILGAVGIGGWLSAGLNSYGVDRIALTAVFCAIFGWYLLRTLSDSGRKPLSNPRHLFR